MTAGKAIITSACLLMAALTGCQSAKTTGTGHLIEPGDALRLGYHLNFALDLGVPRGNRIDHAEVIGDLLVTIEEPINLVTAVSLRDGSIKWRKVVSATSQQLHRPLGVDGRILVNTDTDLYLLSVVDGSIDRLQPLTTTVNHSPAIHGSLAIFGGIDGTVFAHNLKTANNVWRKRMSGSILASPAIVLDRVFVADENGNCTLFSAIDGQVIWKARTFDTIWSPPAMDRLALYLASEDQSLYAIDINDGTDRWVHRTGVRLTKSPMVIEDRVFINLPGNNMQAIDAVTGEVRWGLATNAQPVTMIKDRLLINNTHELLLVDLVQGGTATAVGVRPLQKVIALAGDRLLLISPRGRILRLDPTP